MIKKYLKGDPEKARDRLFLWDFTALFRNDNETVELLHKDILKYGINRLNTFSIDEKSTEFSQLINQIAALCEFITFNSEGSSLNDIIPQQFRKQLKEVYLEMQDFF